VHGRRGAQRRPRPAPSARGPLSESVHERGRADCPRPRDPRPQEAPSCGSLSVTLVRPWLGLSPDAPLSESVRPVTRSQASAVLGLSAAAPNTAPASSAPTLANAPRRVGRSTSVTSSSLSVQGLGLVCLAVLRHEFEIVARDAARAQVSRGSRSTADRAVTPARREASPRAISSVAREPRSTRVVDGRA
jgi:hypothetical protein